MAKIRGGKRNKQNLLKKTTFIEDILECRQLHLILEWYSKNDKKTLGQHIKKYFSK